MVERLIDFLLELWKDVLPFEVIPHYNRGVRLRLGKQYGLELGAGFHWKIPFVDQIMTHMVKVKTLSLSEQTITTKDNRSIVVRAVIKYEVSDVVTLMLEVNDAIDAIADMTKGVIRRTLMDMNWEECNNTSVDNSIAIKARVEAKKWGIYIVEVTLTDLGEMRSIRLLNSTMKDEQYL